MSFHQNRYRGTFPRNTGHFKSNFGKYSGKLGTNPLSGIPYFCNMINMNQIVV